MALNPGAQLGPYEILAPLGAGGMGEVYKACDTRLDRSVAVKVLPDHIAHREDARARFEREARAVASLNHPNICTLFDIGPNYMVMELIEGETLADRIGKGALPLDQALRYAVQIADALDRAHRAGVTHRDIKPQNIMITRDGVKVLDFGLAKSSTVKPGPTEETLTKVLTAEGTVVGTPQYMAPEQFEGKEADARSDIWAFGAVLYEMVTGRKAFEGKNYSSLVGAILSADPPHLKAGPAWLEHLLHRCWVKDPENRWQSVRDVLLELREPSIIPPPSSSHHNLRLLVFAALGLLAGVLAIWRFLPPSTATPAPSIEFTIAVPGGASSVAVSPDGKFIAWRDNAKRALWIRPLDSVTAHMVSETSPRLFSWSPDGRFLVYTSRAGLGLFDTAVSATKLLSTQDFGQHGLAATVQGEVLAGAFIGPIMRVLRDGRAIPALRLDTSANEIAQRQPALLPDGEHVLYFSWRSNPADSGICLARLDGTAAPVRLHRAVSFRFMPPDTVLLYEDGVLQSAKLDTRAGRLGELVPLLKADIRSFSASAEGRIFALVIGRNLPDRLAVLDRSGKRLRTWDVSPSGNAHVEFSPDGKRILFERNTGRNTDLWTVDSIDGNASRLTFDEGADGPGVWSNDGNKVFYHAVNQPSGEGIYEIPANGSSSGRLILKTATHHLHASPNGKYLLFERAASRSGLDFVDLSKGNQRATYLDEAATSPQFSPDSRFIAYESSESGQSQIYVQSFPAGNGKWQISISGGIEPRWSRGGREIIFDEGDGTLIAAELGVEGRSLQVNDRKELFRFDRGRDAGTSIAVSADGNTFVIRETPVSAEASILVRVGWRRPDK